MRIHGMSHVNGAVIWYRVRTPMLALKEAGHHVTEDYTRQSFHIIPKCDVCVVSGLPGFSERDLDGNISRIKENAGTFVLDMDDDLWDHIENRTDYHFIEKDEIPEYVRYVDNIVQQADICTTTNAYLAHVMLNHGAKHIEVVPNMLMDKAWKREPDWSKKGRVIGYAGGRGHINDTAIVRPVLKELLRDYAGVKFKWGGAGNGFEDYEPFEQIPNCRPSQYREHMLDHMSITLCPLEEIHFTRCKSDLKLLEGAASGNPVIASPVRPYMEHALREWVTICSTDEEWYNAIAQYLEDPDLMIQHGKLAREYAKTRFASANVPLWEEVYGGRV